MALEIRHILFRFLLSSQQEFFLRSFGKRNLTG